MKKFRSKVLSCILAFAVCLGCFPAPVYAAPMEKKASEEFALGSQVTGYAVPADSKAAMSSRTIVTYASTPVPTEAQARTKMLALKSKYPEGTTYTNDNYYEWNGGIYVGGYGCAGFAFMLSDAAFGDLPAAMISTNITINKVHVGDILRLNNDSHSVIITDVYADHVVIAEGNYNYSVHWGRTLTAAEVAKADYVLTRYPAGTFGDNYLLTFDANGGTNAPSSQYIYAGTPITSSIPIRSSYEFVGWATSSTATTAQYQPGDVLSLNGPKKLYAVWKKSSTPTTTSPFPNAVNISSKLNTKIEVNLYASKLSAVYKFTAPATDTYVIASKGDYDPILYVYDENGTMIGESDDVIDHNFQGSISMDKGDTIYLKTKLYQDQSVRISYEMYIISEADYIKSPINVKATPSSTGITLSWSKRTGAVKYYVFYGLNSADTFSSVATTTTNSCNITGIDSGKLYKFAVIAVDSKNFKSDPSSICTGRYFTKMSISSIKNTSSGLKLSWNKKTGAKGYKIYRKSASATKYTLIKTITDGSVLTYTDTAVKTNNGIKYTYYVKPYNGTVVGSASVKSYYRLKNTNVATLTNPYAGKMKVTWAKNSKVTAYQIQYSKSSSFASGNKTVTVSGASKISTTIASLTKGKKYYVRIRTYKTVDGKKYYSAWCTKKSITITR